MFISRIAGYKPRKSRFCIVHCKIAAFGRTVRLQIPLLRGDVAGFVAFQVIVAVAGDVAGGGAAQDFVEGDMQEDAQIEVGIDGRAVEQDAFHENNGVTADGVAPNGGERVGIQIEQRERCVERFTALDWGQQFAFQEGQVEGVIEVAAHHVRILRADGARVVEVIPVDEGHVAALRLQESREVLREARLAGGIHAVDADDARTRQGVRIQSIRNDRKQGFQFHRCRDCNMRCAVDKDDSDVM